MMPVVLPGAQTVPIRHIAVVIREIAAICYATKACERNSRKSLD